MLTLKQKELIKNTVPVLKESGNALTTYFYNRMFTHNPELRNMFNMGNQQNGKQSMALAMAVLAYAENIDNPSVMKKDVNRIGNKHVSLNIRKEHYPIVGNHLLASIKEVLGKQASDELIDAWGAAYNQLAGIMIGVEDNMYATNIATKGGWSGWRPFVIQKKQKESDEISSLYLYPIDGGSVADFFSGQYLSVKLFIPSLNLVQARQYSISNAPNGKYYRISVKREDKKENLPEGMVSNMLNHSMKEGDIVELSAPAGEFILNTKKETPVVFISGGIGQTPLLSMLEHLTENNSKRNITWVHGCRTPAVHAFKTYIEELGTKNKITTSIFYDVVVENSNCYTGVVDVSVIKEQVLHPEADYYICGPTQFIKKQFEDLTALGIKRENVFYEEFAPASITLN
ncbi:MAG: NO-inducible flavohemoprotein [Bacteroidia bacterium]